jgi:hypothetical protein
VSLKVYTIHVKPSAALDVGVDPDIILVPEGFSFLAFLLQGFWALYHRLWLVGLGMFVAGFLLQALAGWLTGEATIVITVNLALAILMGAEARNLWRWTLERRGYDQVGVVLGETLEDAERRYFGKAFSEGGFSRQEGDALSGADK